MVARILTVGFVGVVLNTPLAQIAQPTAAELTWLSKNLIDVKTVEAGTGFEDLRRLKAVIGDARIVSLGESTHGSSEIFQMKHRLVEYLANELGFTIFSIEANMPEAYRLNDYVLTGKGDAKALLEGMYFWTWNTEEVLAMIEWMRQFNAASKGRIEFTGFDMQTPNVAMEIVREFLAKVDPQYASAVSTIYADATKARAQPSANGFGVATGTFPVKAAAGKKIKFSGAIKTADVSAWAGLWWRADGPTGSVAFDNMANRGPRGTTDWTRYDVVLDIPSETVNINFGVLMPGTGRAWFDDLHVEIDGAPYDAAGLFDFDFESGQVKGFWVPPAAYRVTIDGQVASRGTYSLRIDSPPADTTAKPIEVAEVSRKVGDVVATMEKARGEYQRRANSQAIEWAIQNARIVHQSMEMTANHVFRDESMARNVKWILDHAPQGTRIVLWAHNGHVNRHREGRVRAMGSYLDEWYGKEHVVVGFATNHGEYSAIGRGTGSALGPHPLKTAQSGSYEYVFAHAGSPRFILDLRAAREDDPASGWLRKPMEFRSIGAAAMEQQFQTANLMQLFDVIVFLDATTPTRGLWPQRR